MKILILCLSFLLTNCITYTAQIDTRQNGVHSDTIQYIMQYDSVLSKTDTVALYAWEETDGDSIWLDTSRIKPDIIDTIYIPYAPIDYWEGLQSRPNVRSYIPVGRNYSLYHNSVDTFFMQPIYENGMLVYEFDTIRVPLEPDSIIPFLEKHPPLITNREELMVQLDTLYEGYRTMEHLMAQHIVGDYISYSFIDVPSFLNRHRSTCTLLPEGLMYRNPGSLDGNLVVLCSAHNQDATIDSIYVPVEDEGGMMGRWIIEPIKEHAGNSYKWGVYVTNRFNAADTLWFETYVTPFDSTVWDE